jgi:hypothetical protein
MTKQEFQAIVKRNDELARTKEFPDGARAVIICEQKGRPIHPIDLGFAEAKRFEEHCAAIGSAAKDRSDLLKMLIDDFDIEDYFKE